MKFLNKPGKIKKVIGSLSNIEEPTISIITPFYNGGSTLEETANTIFNQTYPYFEWIIVDDGSKSESCLKKLDEISKKDSRIKVYHKENGGPSQARDFGISKASKSSKYIYFLDCDDLIENTMLEEMYWSLETHPNASWVYAAFVNFGAYEYYWEPYFTLEEELVLNTMCISSMIRKDHLLEVGCFGIKEKAMYEDWNLWLKLLAKGRVPIRLNAPLFWYRTSFSGELSRAKSNHKKAMKLINSTAKTVKNEVDVIQFPRISSPGPTTNNTQQMLLPSYKKEKQNTILFVVDNINLNKNSMTTIETIKRLSKTNNCILITTEPSKNNLRQDIKDYVSELHDLSNFLDTKDYPLFINYLISSRNVDSLVINNSAYAYAMLPELKNNNKLLKVIEYIEESPVEVRNEKIANLIDLSLTANKELAKKYNINLIESNKKQQKEEKSNTDELKEKLDLPKDKIIISYIDNLTYERRPNLFLDIIKKLPNELFFVINGNGRLSTTISEQIKKEKLTNVVYINEQENYDTLYKVSDVIVNCALKEAVSSTNYKALLHGIPVVSTTADFQEEIVTDKTGILVSEASSNSEDYANAIKMVIEKLSIYKNNVKEKMNQLNNKYNSLAAKIETCQLKSEKNHQAAFTSEVYTYYENILKDKFKKEYLTYYQENLHITPRDSITPGPISKKHRLRALAIKYNIENEMIIIFNWLKSISALAKNILEFIKNTLKSIVMLIPLLVNIIKIILKLIRKLLSIIKQKLLQIIKK